MSIYNIPASVTLSNTSPQVPVLNFEGVADVVERLGDTLIRQQLSGGMDIVAGNIDESIEVVLAVDPASGSGIIVRWKSNFEHTWIEPYTLDNGGYQLGDAEALNSADSAAFPIPPLAERVAMPIGYRTRVKLLYLTREQDDNGGDVVRSEPVWVYVCDQHGPAGIYRGVTTKKSRAGSKGREIFFQPRHIVEIELDCRT